MLKAALVDLDGTLVDTHAAILAAYCQALEDLGLDYVADELERGVGVLAWRPMLARVLPDKGLDVHQAVAERKRVIYPNFFDRVVVNRALVAVLQALRPAVAIALVTSASRGSVEPLLAAKGLASLFDTTVTSDDVTRQKPDPESYAIAAARLGATPPECLVFEDSDIGMAAARAFGCQVWQIHGLNR